ncbi:ELMO domain-containing protein F-like [Centruroides sculpturatus]|uniref:ELMO domain-containing protein F-like n=1 Tax=Centruroides sculpturatus TaxID=218467 RepID=UPI000C6DB602|nr:ELMO domain-containing protein F-like [Centruroides sculpturatus]
MDMSNEEKNLNESNLLDMYLDESQQDSQSAEKNKDNEKCMNVNNNEASSCDVITDEQSNSSLQAPQSQLPPMVNEESQSSVATAVSEEQGIDLGNCYCGRERNLNTVELQCAGCLKWFHDSCITFPLG